MIWDTRGNAGNEKLAWKCMSRERARNNDDNITFTLTTNALASCHVLRPSQHIPDDGYCLENMSIRPRYTDLGYSKTSLQRYVTITVIDLLVDLFFFVIVALLFFASFLFSTRYVRESRHSQGQGTNTRA